MEENVLRIIEKVIENSRNYEIKVTSDGELTINVNDKNQVTPIIYPPVEPPIKDFTEPWTYKPTTTGTEYPIYATISNTSNNKE